jgi:NADH-quinone oxidoreductase subunit J
MFDLAMFYIFAVLAIGAAILAVTRKNVIHSAVFLATTLLATAGIFLTLHAEFLFIVQIILYTGGILVLYVFVIMLVNLDLALQQVQFNRRWYVGLLLTVVLGTQVFAAILMSRQSLYALPAAPVQQLEPNTEQVAWGLFHTYVLPFEIASVLLLVAMVGGVIMAKKRI